MKKQLAFTLIFTGFLCITAWSQHKKIILRKITLEQARAAALKEHKRIFIDVGTSWCGPCKHMEKTVFANDTVADYYNANFVSIKLDLERGEGIAIGEKFNIVSVPMYLFLDSTGNLDYKMKSAMSAGEFLAHGKRANDPQRNLAYYQKHFPEKKDSLQFLEEYLHVLTLAGMSSPDALKAYLSLQNGGLISEKNWNILKTQATDLYSDEFAYMMTNRKAYAEKVSSEEVTNVLDRRIEKEFEKIIYNRDTFKVEDFTRARNYVSSLHYEQGDQLIFEADLKAAMKTGDWDSYAMLCLEKAEFYYLNKPSEISPLSEIAYNINEHFGTGKLLDKAEFWAKSDAERNPYYFSYLAYAQILYKNNKNEEALVAAKKAKKYAVETGYKYCINTADELLKNIYKKVYARKNSG